MPNQVSNWSEALMTSVSGALAVLLAAIPKILGFAAILIIGWILASLLARGIAALLRKVQFNDLAGRSGFSEFVKSMGVETDASGFIALIAKWFVRLLALVVAFDALGLPAVSDVLRQLLLWLPNLVVGLVVLVLGGLAANAVSSLVRGASARAELGNPETLATVAKVAIWGFAIVIAVNQIGVAQTLINTLFMAIVGSAALALGLAFGLGGRETAAKILAQWYDKGLDMAPELKAAAKDVASATADKSPSKSQTDGRKNDAKILPQ